jgi:hypothetical protein
MGEVNKKTEGVTPGVIDTHEVTLKVRVQNSPNMTQDGLTEFPCTAVLVYSNGTRVVLPIRQPKPSSASGKINAWGGGKIALEDNTQVQVGINLTILD